MADVKIVLAHTVQKIKLSLLEIVGLGELAISLIGDVYFSKCLNSDVNDYLNKMRYVGVSRNRISFELKTHKASYVHMYVCLL